MTFRPGGSRVVAYAVSVLMIVLTAVIGLSLPDDIEFTTAETVTLWLVILAVLVILHGIGRSYVRVTDSAVVVLNGYRKTTVGWDEIAGFSMTEGAPWGTLVTKDDRRVMLFAIQRSDGPASRRAMAALRERLP